MSKLSLLDKIQWALGTIENKLTFGLPEAQAAIARERRVHGVLMDAEKEVKELEDHLIGMAEEARLVGGSETEESPHYKFAMELRAKRPVKALKQEKT